MTTRPRILPISLIIEEEMKMTSKKRFFPTLLALTCVLVLLAVLLGGNGCSRPQESNSSVRNVNAETIAGTKSSVSCTNASSDQILMAIYKELDYRELSRVAWQYNITVAGPSVTIIGHSKRRDAVLNAIEYAAKGCGVNDDNFKEDRNELDPRYLVVQSCGPGHTPCGDICLPINQQCQIGSAVVGEPFISDNKALSNSNSNIGVSSTPNTKAANGNSNAHVTKKP
jgi:hypothetical protein